MCTAGVPPGGLQLPGVVVERVVFLGLPKKGAFKAKLPGGKVRGCLGWIVMLCSGSAGGFLAGTTVSWPLRVVL